MGRDVPKVLRRRTQQTIVAPCAVISSGRAMSNTCLNLPHTADRAAHDISVSRLAASLLMSGSVPRFPA